MATDIHVLIRQAQDGDQRAFDELYTTFYTPVFRYLLLRAGNREDAEDLAEDTFLKFFKALPTFTLAGSSILPYLFTVARNGLIDQSRKRSHEGKLDEELFLLLPDTEPDPEAQSQTGQDVDVLKKTLRLLPQGEQAAVTLRYLDGLSTAETAETLGKSEEAVRQLLSRGIRRLRSLLESKL